MTYVLANEKGLLPSHNVRFATSRCSRATCGRFCTGRACRFASTWVGRCTLNLFDP
jgi:hypothetical protein